MVARCLFVLLLFPGWILAQQKDEIRKSIYFPGGSYFIDEDQANDLYHWLDSIPNLSEKFEIQLISHTDPIGGRLLDRKSTRLNSSHANISYAVFCLKKKKNR